VCQKLSQDVRTRSGLRRPASAVVQSTCAHDLGACIQDHGKTSATASLGMITLWDVEGGLPQIDKYLYSRDNHVVAGILRHPMESSVQTDTIRKASHSAGCLSAFEAQVLVSVACRLAKVISEALPVGLHFHCLCFTGLCVKTTKSGAWSFTQNYSKSSHSWLQSVLTCM